MTIKQTSTVCNFDFELFKSLSNFENNTLILNEFIAPDFIFLLDNFVGNGYEVLYVKKNSKCSECGSELIKNGKDSFLLNKSRQIKLQKYKCSNNECEKFTKTSLIEHIDKSCNYTKNIRECGLNMGLIFHSSYGKKSEIIDYFKGVKIPRSTAYYHENILSKEYLENEQKKIEKLLKEANIEPSGYYHYDEQYVFINAKLHYRMTLIDSTNNLIIDEKLISHKEFDKNTIKNFLEKSLSSLPLEAIITDGDTSYPSIIEALGAIHQKCIFHKMQNLMFKVLKKHKQYKRQIKRHEQKVKHNIKKIQQLKEKNKGKCGRIKLKDKKKQKTRNKIKKIEKETRQLKALIRENKDKIKELEKYVDKISLIFKSKTEQTLNNRLKKLINKIEELPEEIATFVKKLSKTIENFTQHLYNNNIPNTNNKIELYYKTTMPRYMKRTFRTTKGFLRKIKQQQIRWTKRNVLNIK